jgi:mevalonate kinase
MWNAFKTSVPGKWVLAGEHSVLHGGIAVALPHPEFSLTLAFDPQVGSKLVVEPPEAESILTEILGSIANNRKANGESFDPPAGKLQIQSTIPIGAGLGSSAALCVALTRWLADPLGISQDRQVEFATQLEHRFHGRSSGMDVAVIAAGEPISFGINQGLKVLGIKNLPRFTFHDTRLRSKTSDCVMRVEKFREENLEIGKKLDDQMANASQLAINGLVLYDQGNREEGLNLIRQGMAQARECFYSWELVPGAGMRLEEQLLHEGALAVKMTGAGGGGFVVALLG